MADETPSISSLQMDRGLPIGNQQDVFGRRALDVIVGNSNSQPIPVTVTSGTTGTPFFTQVQTETTPGSQQTLLSFVVSAPTQSNLTQLVVICRQESEFFIQDNNTMIGSGRTGAASPNASFTWNPNRAVPTGDTITVLFEARAGSPISDVECYLMAVNN